MNKTSVKIDFQNHDHAGEEISQELAAKMVKNYHDQNPTENFQCADISKEILEKILNQPDCAGIRIMNAKCEHDGSNKLVYIGFDKENNTLYEISSIDNQGRLNTIKGIASSSSIRCAGGQTKPGGGGWWFD